MVWKERSRKRAITGIKCNRTSLFLDYILISDWRASVPAK